MTGATGTQTPRTDEVHAIIKEAEITPDIEHYTGSEYDNMRRFAEGLERELTLAKEALERIKKHDIGAYGIHTATTALSELERLKGTFQ